MDDYDQAIADLGQGNPGQAQAVGAAQDNPDHAAEALSLSKATGAPAGAIYNDLPGFKAAAKQQTAAGLVAGNPQLGRYVSDPMAARVSNDDLGTLDAMSEPLNNLNTTPPWLRPQPAPQGRILPEQPLGASVGFRALGAAAQGFSDAASTEGDTGELAAASDGDVAQGFYRGIAPWATAASMGVKLPGAVFNAGIEGLNSLNRDLTGDKTDTLSRDLNVYMMGEMGKMAEHAARPYTPTPMLNSAQEISAPFLAEGKAPPAGLNPIIDAAHASQNASDLAALNTALDHAQESLTRSRAPEKFAEFIRQHTGDQTIGISHDAARAVYGDKVPEPGDGKLGFVADLPSQLLRSAVTGEDIHIPVADYLTAVDPALHKELEPFIRTRPDGVTQTEAEVAKPAESGPVEPVPQFAAEDALARTAGLRPDDTSEMYMHERPILYGQDARGLLQEPDGDKIHVESKDVTDQGYTARYSNVGKPESLGDVMDGLGKIANADAMTHANAEVMREVFAHTGADQVPVYTVQRDNPAGGQHLGTYYPGSDAITIRHTGDPEQTLRVANHEGLHAAFGHAIDNVPEIKDGVTELLNHALTHDPDYTYGPDDHYGLSNIHEFISEAFSNPEFQQWLSKIPAPADLIARLKLDNLPRSGLASLWDGLLMMARKAFGMPLTDDSLSLLDASFKLGDRMTAIERDRATGGVSYGAYPAEPQALPDPLSGRAASVGMNRRQLDRYRELLGRQREEQLAARNAQILREERKRQEPEWAANKVQVRKEMSDAIANRRDVVADSQFTAGTRLDTDSLTPGQRESLAGLHTRNGLDPESYAKGLGYDSVDDLAGEVSALRADRGTQRAVDYRRKQVSDATDSEMERRYGDLQGNVVQAAKERVLSETQMEVLQMESEHAGNPATKAQLEANVREAVGDMPMSALSSSAAMQAAGRAAAGIEDALLKGDAKEAFAQRMRQYNHLLAAKRMVEVEKAKAKFDKITKRYAEREVAGANQEYTDQIHGIMVNKLGLFVKRSVQDIQVSMEKGGYPTLQDFVSAKEAGFRDLFIPDTLLGDRATPVDQLTVSQFEDVHRAFEALTFNSRDELKIDRNGEKADLRATIGEMTDAMKTLGPPKPAPVKGLRNLVSHTWWSLINMEKLLNRLDYGDRNGVFSQTLTRQFTEASNYKESLLKEYSKRLNEHGRIPDYEAQIKNDLFIDPATGQPMPMRKKDVLGVLQNVGNPSNMEKLAAGWKVDPGAVMQFLFKNTTKEDWDRAQSIGGLFNELHDRADTMSRNVSGVGIDKIPLHQIDTPFGTYDGWYHPVKYSDYHIGKSKALLGANALEQEGYYRATTPKGYTKSRTGYVAPVDLSMDAIAPRMHQIIHDVTMRPAVIQLGKFFTDPEFRQNMKYHVGQAQDAQLIPFLRDMANAPNYSSASASVGNAFLREMSSNMTSTLVGLNFGTLMKHSTTAALKSAVQSGPAFGKELVTLLRDSGDGRSNWRMAMEKSEELQRRMANFGELMSGTGQSVTLSSSSAGSRFKDFRSVAQYLGSVPIGVTDLMSAVPTWLVAYKDAIARGENEGNAKFFADSDVRDTHGSSIQTNKPQMTRTNDPIKKSFAALYNVFSENLQKQYELGWRAKEAYGNAKEGEWDKFRGQIPKIAALALTSIVLPALVEEWVTGEGDPKEGWGHKSARVLANGLSSSVIGLRDMERTLTSGYSDSGGMIGTMEKAITDPVKDFKPVIDGKPMNPDRRSRLIQHAFTLTGLATGLTNTSEGRALEYVYRYTHGLEHPHDPWQAMSGLRHGQTRRR